MRIGDAYLYHPASHMGNCLCIDIPLQMRFLFARTQAGQALCGALAGAGCILWGSEHVRTIDG